jgi:hypothetical protein
LGGGWGVECHRLAWFGMPNGPPVVLPRGRCSCCASASCSVLLRCPGSRRLLRFRCCWGPAGCSSCRCRLVRRRRGRNQSRLAFGPLLPGFLVRQCSHALHDPSTCGKARPHAGQRRCCTWKFGLRPGLRGGTPVLHSSLVIWAHRRVVEVARELLRVVERSSKRIPMHLHAVQGAPGVFWYAPSNGPGHPVLWNLCSRCSPLCRLSALKPTFPAAMESELPGTGGGTGLPVRWDRTPIPAPRACPGGPFPEISKILKKTRHNYQV